MSIGRCHKIPADRKYCCCLAELHCSNSYSDAGGPLPLLLRLLSRLLLFDCIQRNFFLMLSGHCVPQRLLVVCIDLSIKPPTTDRYVELLAIDELIAAHDIHVYDKAVNGSALSSVTGASVTVIEMAEWRGKSS